MNSSVTSYPLSILDPNGNVATQISPLLLGLLWLSVGVVAFIAIAVVAGALLRRTQENDPSQVAVARFKGGVWWIYVGVGVSTIILVGFTVWTVLTMSGIARPPNPVGLSIDVSARQWWWSFRYEGTATGDGFTTANEIHIPVGVPVHFNLTSPDVIHSFWVPALGGKTDVIPGRTNQIWLEAEKAGAYRGQCSEYCGLQHAQMGLYVIAEPADRFAAWEAEQRSVGAAPTTSTLAAGQASFVQRCGDCHSVIGTDARGIKGPDLTHVMSRTTIAAGILDNTVGNLAGWIAHPQGIKPGALMPDVKLSGPEFQSILKYVETLK